MDTVKAFFEWKNDKNRKTVEENNKNNSIVSKWDKLDVLYSFIGIYTIGIYVFYPKLCNRTDYQIRRGDNKKAFFSSNYLSNNYMNYPELNKVIEEFDFIKVYDTLGNVIPIWPGGNEDRGTRAQCFDIPEIYFCKKHPRWFKNLCNEYPEAKLQLIENERFILDTKEFLDNMNKDTYKEYLQHIVEVIRKRTEIIRDGKNEI